MVATAKARKTLVNTDGGYYTSHYHHQQHQTPRNNTNRRNIVGLSEAIREKAFQSTSPSSEATNGNSSSNFRSNYETAVAMRRDQERSTRKQPLTVEERLRKLLHSEAESTDAESYIENKFSNSYNSKKTSKMPLRLRSKTPNPHVSNTYSSATLNRSTNYRQQMESFNEEQTTMASSHHNTTQPNHQQVRSQYFHTSQRRCKSAVPAAFHDHEWNNKISDKPATNPPANHHHHHHQSSAHHHQHQQQQQQQQHVNNSNKTCKSEQNLSKSQQQRNFPMTSYQIVGRAPPGGGKPVPAVRRSLHADSGFDSSRSTTNNNHEQQHQQQTHSNNNNKKQQQQRNTYVIKSQLSLANQYDDVTIAVHPPPYGSVQHITNEPPTTTRQGPHHHEPRRCMTPAPDKRRTTHRQRGDQSPVAVTSSRHATPTSSRKSKESGKSAQQNISFRRAIRATSSEDENLHASSQQQQQPRGSAAPPHVVKRMTSSGQTSLSSCATTKATGKSDDRDSGAVLHETPGSVFDFESSVCSELDPQQQRRHHQRTDVIVSRSDTPLLPPLDDDVITEEEEMEDKMKRSHHHHQHPEVYSGSNAATTVNNLTVVAGYKVPTLPQKKKEDHFSAASNNQSIRDNDAVSNLIDFVKIEERKQQQRARYRGGAGGDEKDNEAETKLQQQQQQQQQAPSNCNCSSQKNSQEHAGSRGAGGAFNPLQDLYDSESIFSLTTASVCSSAIRGRGKRHRHGSSSKRGGGGQGKGDKYAKEIRSINKRFSRLETHVVSLARTLAQLGNDIRHQAVSAHQIDQLRNEVKELRTRQESMEQQQQQQQTPHKATSKKSSKESSKPKMNKFTKFFSEPQQPSLLNLFLKRLGYEKYLKNFQQQSIGMSELPYMEEKQLEAIGIPLGPRSRILTEARKSSFV